MLFLTKTRRKPQQLWIRWRVCAMRMWRGGVENTTLPTKLVGGDPVGPYPAGSPSYMSFLSLGDSSVRYIPAPSLRCSRSILFAVKSKTRIAVSFGPRRSQYRHDDRRAGDSSGGVLLTLHSQSTFSLLSQPIRVKWIPPT